MEGEKAERRIEDRNRSVQWQEVSFAQIPCYDRQLRAWPGQDTEGKPTGAGVGWAKTYILSHTYRYTRTDYMKRLKKYIERTCTNCTYYIMGESEHKTMRIVTTLVYPSGELFLHRVRWHASKKQGSRASGSEGNCDVLCECVCCLPCSCWTCFPTECVWCWVQDGIGGENKQRNWVWKIIVGSKDGDT